MKFKFLFSFLTVLSLFLFFLSPVLAVRTSPGADPLRYSIPVPQKLESTQLEKFQEATLIQQDFNKETFDAQSFTDILNTINTGILGCVSPKICPPGEPTGSGGAINLVGSVITFMYDNPPASGITYFADIGKKLNLIQPAYAQGQGFSNLNSSGVLDIWRGFRNFGYLIFAILFVALGFAIMFRMRINPQTVITIQSAIPRIILSLILVTSSFALAGLLLDLAFLSTGLFDKTLDLIGLPPTTIGNIVGNVGITTIIAGITALLGLIPGVGWLGVAMIGTALGVLALFAILRLFWLFLQAYISILLRVILAPIIIVFNTLPGRPIFWGWLGGLLAEVSVFITGYVVWRLGWVLFASFGPGLNPIVPLPLGFGIIDLLKGLFMLGIIFMIPNIANMVKEMIVRGFQVGELPGRDLGIAVVREGAIARGVGTGAVPASKTQALTRALYRVLGGRGF